MATVKIEITIIAPVLQAFSFVFQISLVFNMFSTFMFVRSEIEWNLKVKTEFPIVPV